MRINDVVSYDTVRSFAGFQIQQRMNFDAVNGRNLASGHLTSNGKFETSRDIAENIHFLNMRSNNLNIVHTLNRDTYSFQHL